MIYNGSEKFDDTMMMRMDEVTVFLTVSQQGRTGPGGKGGVPPQAPCLIKFIRIDIDLYIR